jgi:hypothetical protein
MFFAHAAAAAIKLAGFAASGQESCWCFVRPWFGLLFPLDGPYPCDASNRQGQLMGVPMRRRDMELFYET